MSKGIARSLLYSKRALLKKGLDDTGQSWSCISISSWLGNRKMSKMPEFQDQTYRCVIRHFQGPNELRNARKRWRIQINQSQDRSRTQLLELFQTRTTSTTELQLMHLWRRIWTRTQMQKIFLFDVPLKPRQASDIARDKLSRWQPAILHESRPSS